MAIPNRQNVEATAPYYYDEASDKYVSWDAKLKNTSTEPVITSSAAYAVRVDEASTTVTYVGEAAPGSSEGSAVWRIKRLTDSSGDLTIEWADGNENFDNIYSDRASLSYS